jgi:NAD(P)-dependent dehydrogenase (short-subunit alcohol dehydrogenase family)
MQGKTVVITGATSGIGEVAALALAKMGARIVVVARSKARGEETLARFRGSAPAIAHALYVGDLLRLSEMKRLAAEIAAAEARVDVLINNAGAMFGSRKLTEDGLERTFALNHMAYFVLTAGLRERLKAAPAARIVNTASDAHRGSTLNLDQIQSASGFGGMKAYSHSKLCNILFTRELARRLRGSAVTTNCLHPGFVATRFGDESGGLISGVIGFAKLFAISPAQGADTIVHLGSAPEVAETSGEYFYRRRPATPTAAARDDRAALALWQRSAALAGIEE